ncbi:MAG: hypothetical protein ACYTAN_14775 [Planctomycetota bacterium]|jgi:hypothetical protein
MAGMSREDIEDRLRKTELATSEAFDTKVMSLIEDGPERGGRTSKRRLFRLTVSFAGAAALAAALLLAFLVGPADWGGEEASAAEFVEEAVAASESSKWIFAKWINHEGRHTESGMSLKPFRLFEKGPVWITFRDSVKKETYRYEVSTGMLTVQSFWAPYFDVYGESPTYFDGLVAKLKREGAVLSRSNENVGGAVFDVVTAAAERSRSHEVYRVFVEPGSKRIVRLEHRMTFEGGTVRSTSADFEYSQHGPEDIYALGVPRDTKVIDKRLPETAGLLEAAWKRSRGFSRDYYAVIFEKSRQKDGSYSHDQVYQVFKSGHRFRVERYNMSHFAARHRELSAVFDTEDISLISEEFRHMKPYNIHLGYDDRRDSQLVDARDGRLVVKPWGEGWRFFTPEGHSWGFIPFTMNFISGGAETDGEFGKLRGAVETQSGLVSDGKVVAVPSRIWRYYNPERDFVREEYLSIQDGSGPDWQEDKDWLEGVEGAEEARKKKIKHTRKVTEYGRTSDGEWYAKRIVEDWRDLETGKNSGSMVIILLDTTREIPEEVFDVSRIKVEDLH